MDFLGRICSQGGVVKSKIDFAASAGVISLDTGEELNLHHLDVAVRHVFEASVGVLNIELILDAQAMNDFVDALAQRGFGLSGNVSEGNNTKIRMRKALRSSGDGRAAFNPEITVTPTPIPPSDVENQAVAEIMSRYSDAEVNARIQRLPRKPEAA